MRRTTIFVGVLALTLLPLADSRGAVPQTVNFQGRLADASGTPVTDTVNITFRVYDASAGGTSCHTSTHGVTVESGLFNVPIGPIDASCDFAFLYYLELQVEGDSPMSPRIRFTSAPYALRAGKTEESLKLQGFAPGDQPGQIPWNGNLLMNNLNADMVGGKHASDLSMTTPIYDNGGNAGTTGATLKGYMR